MIQTIETDLIAPVGFYDDYELMQEDIDWLISMAEEGNGQEAVDILINEFILPPGTKYSDLARRYLELSSIGVIEEKNRNKMIRNLALLSLGLSTLLSNNFSKFIRNVYAPDIFKRSGLTNAEVKRTILDEVIGQFDQSINGAMSQTQSFVINGIRSLQREMIAENLMLKKSKFSQELVDVEVKNFKKSLKMKYPSLYKGMENGNILVSRKFVDGVEKVRHYKLDYYVDLTTRTILLDIDRTTNLINATVNQDRVVEYAEIDPRIVTKDREICQEVLDNKINGKSLLALDQEAADALGIMTVDELLASPQSPMGNGCRHGVLQCEGGFLKEINKLIEQSA